MIKRQSDILIYIKSQNDYIAAKKLSDHFSVTTRTLRSDVRKINDIIKDQGAEITSSRNKGYRLEIYNPEKFDEYWYDFLIEQQSTIQLETTEERIKHLIIYLLYANDYVNIEELANEVHISVSTVLTYLKNIRGYLEIYDLSLKNKINFGYIVEGEEIDKRKCILKTVESNVVNIPTKFNIEQRHLFTQDTLQKIENIILSSEKMNIEFSDYDLKNLVLHIALLISRVDNNQTIEDFYLPEFDQDIKINLNNMLSILEKEFNISIPLGERNYIFTRFFTNSRTIIKEIDHVFIDSVIEDILDVIYQQFGHDFRSDQILINDLKTHLEAVMTLKYFDLKKENPLLNTIKSNYPYEFEITIIALNKTLKRFPEILTEDEIAYISLHIGAALHRSQREIDKPLNAILICGSGHATARILEADLKNYFNNKIIIQEQMTFNEFSRKEKLNADLILSTVPLDDTHNIPVVNLGIPIKKASIDLITKLIDRQSSNVKLNKYFQNKYFHNFRSFKHKEEAIKIMSDTLFENNIVDEMYYKSVLERERLASTLMDNKIAVPHPLSASAYKTKISVAIFDKPIKWDNDNTA